MASSIKNRPLIEHVDSSKVDSEVLKKARLLVGEHQKDYLKSTTNHCPVQLDLETYKLLQRFKADYDVYYYDAIKESLLLMASLLKNKRG